MEWLIQFVGDHWGPLAALVVFLIAVWIELSNFLPIRQGYEQRKTR